MRVECDVFYYQVVFCAVVDMENGSLNGEHNLLSSIANYLEGWHRDKVAAETGEEADKPWSHEKLAPSLKKSTSSRDERRHCCPGIVLLEDRFTFSTSKAGL